MFKRHVCNRLHLDHQATLALWSSVQATLAAGREDPVLMRRAADALERELATHFELEEKELFPRLAAAGEGDIGELLTEEHAVIREAGRRFIELARGGGTLRELRPLGLELAERIFAHVHKEELGLVPLVEDVLDDEADEALSLAYAS
jgi:hemerythrin-like domain-containing protein